MLDFKPKITNPASSWRIDPTIDLNPVPMPVVEIEDKKSPPAEGLEWKVPYRLSTSPSVLERPVTSQGSLWRNNLVPNMFLSSAA